MKRNFGLMATCLPLICAANEIPEPVIPAGVGVNIHFTVGHDKDLDLIAKAGFRLIRMDFGWAGIEREKGQYRWSEYDELMSHLDGRGIRAVLILDYSNPLYEEQVTSINPLTHQSHQTTASPQHPESVAAFARWAAASAKHFQGRHVLWELWNEPNIDFWSPKPDVHQYTTLALAAAKAIREADPQATIIGPATSTFPWDFLETFLSSGILQYLDGISVHPYREPRREPETVASDYQKLRELIERHAPSGKKGKIPILSGEWGYSSWQKGVSIQIQAAFLVRQQLVNLLHGVPLSIWYDWKNDGTDPNENEHNFGTVEMDFNPKPAYAAVETLTRELAGYSVGWRDPLESERDYLLICTNSAGAQKLVAWTLAGPHLLNLALGDDAQFVSGTLGTGDKIMLNKQRERWPLPLSAMPLYVSFRNPALKPR
ncbi:MAG TPA: cellulase family glycosylhydrolase [Patescibacteria group bacterium]|nr:cellulase family glycosylhydrolase [Patescibacteria group bacterium]